MVLTNRIEHAKRMPGLRDVRATEFVDAGDRVVVGIHGPADKKTAFRGLYQLITLRDGRVVQIQDYAKRSKALKAAAVA